MCPFMMQRYSDKEDMADETTDKIKTHGKEGLSWLLCAAMLIGMMPQLTLTARADEGYTVTDGVATLTTNTLEALQNALNDDAVTRVELTQTVTLNNGDVLRGIWLSPRRAGRKSRFLFSYGRALIRKSIRKISISLTAEQETRKVPRLRALRMPVNISSPSPRRTAASAKVPRQ